MSVASSLLSMERTSNVLQALRRGAGAARDEYRELARRRSEPAEFSRVADMAERVHGWLSRAEGHLLWELASRVPETEVVVEIGSFLGRSTTYLGHGAGPGVAVYAIDPHTGDRTWVERFGIDDADTSPAFFANMQKVGLGERVTGVVATSEEAASRWSDDRSVGLLFIDGWHSADAVELDGRLWLPRLSDTGVVVFDDWAAPEVWEGIRRLKRAGLLPEGCGGYVGKDLIFGPLDLDPAPHTRPLTRRASPRA